MQATKRRSELAHRILRLTCWILLLSLGTLPARAATISAFTNTLVIGVGSTATVELRLELAFLEDASIFEGHFDLVGLGSSADASVQLLGFGNTWDSPFGGISLTQLVLSLTSSSNRDDHSLLATIDVVGLAPGSFALVLATGTHVRRDIAVSPVFEELALDTVVGTTLVTIQVVPEPSTGFLVAAGLASLGWFRKFSRGAHRRIAAVNR